MLIQYIGRAYIKINRAGQTSTWYWGKVIFFNQAYKNVFNKATISLSVVMLNKFHKLL